MPQLKISVQDKVYVYIRYKFTFTYTYFTNSFSFSQISVEHLNVRKEFVSHETSMNVGDMHACA